jgi:hypothetical protein
MLSSCWNTKRVFIIELSEDNISVGTFEQSTLKLIRTTNLYMKKISTNPPTKYGVKGRSVDLILPLLFVLLFFLFLWAVIFFIYQ